VTLVSCLVEVLLLFTQCITVFLMPHAAISFHMPRGMHEACVPPVVACRQFITH
jgi:hypothetical protein